MRSFERRIETGNPSLGDRRNGESTQGAEQRRHAIFLANGTQVKDERIPQAAGTFCRIFQDDENRFYLIGSAGLSYSAGNDGLRWGEPTRLDLQGFRVEYSGFGWAVPRTGTARGPFIDFVFPSSNGAKWIYGRLQRAGKGEP